MAFQKFNTIINQHSKNKEPLSAYNRETNMKTNEVRNYLLYDRSATDLKGMKLTYLQAATKDENWDQFLLSDEYDDLLAALKVNPYERAHQAFRREEACTIIKNVDKTTMKVTMLDGQSRTAKFFDNNFFKMQEWVNKQNASYNKRKRKFINSYLAKFKKSNKQKRIKKI